MYAKQKKKNKKSSLGIFIGGCLESKLSDYSLGLSMFIKKNVQGFFILMALTVSVTGITLETFSTGLLLLFLSFCLPDPSYAWHLIHCIHINYDALQLDIPTTEYEVQHKLKQKARNFSWLLTCCVHVLQ